MSMYSLIETIDVCLAIVHFSYFTAQADVFSMESENCIISCIHISMVCRMSIVFEKTVVNAILR